MKKRQFGAILAAARLQRFWQPAAAARRKRPRQHRCCFRGSDAASSMVESANEEANKAASSGMEEANKAASDAAKMGEDAASAAGEAVFRGSRRDY